MLKAEIVGVFQAHIENLERTLVVYRELLERAERMVARASTEDESERIAAILQGCERSSPEERPAGANARRL